MTSAEKIIRADQRKEANCFPEEQEARDYYGVCNAAVTVIFMKLKQGHLLYSRNVGISSPHCLW